MRGSLVFILLAIVLQGCFPGSLSKSERKENKAKKKVAGLLAEFPEIIKTDSLVTIDSIQALMVYEEVFFDENIEADVHRLIDSLRYEISLKCPDLTKNDPAVKKLVKLERKITLENLLPPVTFDTAGAKVLVSAVGNKLKVSVQLPVTKVITFKEKQVVIPCPELGFWSSFWVVRWLIGALVLVICVLFFLIILMK